jgi:hypothetical protein
MLGQGTEATSLRRSGASSRSGLILLTDPVPSCLNRVLIEFAINGAPLQLGIQIAERMPDAEYIIGKSSGRDSGVRIYLVTMHAGLGTRVLLRPRVDQYCNAYGAAAMRAATGCLLATGPLGPRRRVDGCEQSFSMARIPRPNTQSGCLVRISRKPS